jgi:glycosyltransferase involved in cell wall biosynthesis
MATDRDRAMTASAPELSHAPAGAVPKVSVCMITYNHARFIAQALDSALAQRTTFPCEIVVGDDCSTDGTREIVVDYQRRHPDRIRTVLPKRNVGVAANAASTFRACRGEYIALLEGDDYWTDPDKTQLQADLLDRHPDAFLCGSRAHVLRDGEDAPYAVTPEQPSEVLATYGARELFTSSWWFRTCTKMFPRRVLERIPPGFEKDWAGILWLIADTHFGPVCFLDRVVGVYREHAGGIYSSRTVAQRTAVDVPILLKVIPLYVDGDRRRLRSQLRECVATVWSQGGSSRYAMLARALAAGLQPRAVRLAWRDVLAGVRDGRIARPPQDS